MSKPEEAVKCINRGGPFRFRFVKYLNPNAEITVRDLSPDREQSDLAAAIDEQLRREREAEKFRYWLYRTEKQICEEYFKPLEEQIGENIDKLAYREGSD